MMDHATACGGATTKLDGGSTRLLNGGLTLMIVRGRAKDEGQRMVIENGGRWKRRKVEDKRGS